MYQAEVSPKAIRGAIVSGYQWMITIGLLIAAVVANATKDRNDALSYQIPIFLQFIWAAILAGGLALLPEVSLAYYRCFATTMLMLFVRQSPRWLIMRGRDEQAQKALAFLLASPIESEAVNAEFSEIAANLHHERSLGSISYIDCFRNGPARNGLRMWTGIGIQTLQQLTGVRSRSRFAASSR